MEITQDQRLLLSCMIDRGVEKEAVPYLVAALKEPSKTEAMLDWFADNYQKITREDILLKTVELLKR